MSDTMMIAMAGLPASGKSALGEEIRRALNAVLLDKDKVRNFLFSDHVDYSDKQNDLCVDVMYDVTHYLLTSTCPPFVILDGRTYSRRYQIEALKSAARRSDSRLLIIECVCSEESARARLENDQGVHPATDRNFQMYLRSKAGADVILEPKLIIDTDQNSIQQCLEQVLSYVSAP